MPNISVCAKKLKVTAISSVSPKIKILYNIRKGRQFFCCFVDRKVGIDHRLDIFLTILRFTQAIRDMIDTKNTAIIVFFCTA